MKYIVDLVTSWKEFYSMHHGAVAILAIGLGHLVGLGYEASIGVAFWFASREFKEARSRRHLPNFFDRFELWDFLTPTLFSAAYVVYDRWDAIVSLIENIF